MNQKTNQKQKALNCIIKAMKRNAKGIIEFTEDNNIVITDTYAFIIAPLSELNDKQKERINKYYDCDIFSKKEVTHKKETYYGSIEYTHRTKFLLEFLKNKFLNKEFNVKLNNRYTYEDYIVYYDGEDMAKHSLAIDNQYKNMLSCPRTNKNYPMRHNLTISTIDDMTCGVLPLKEFIIKEEKEGSN